MPVMGCTSVARNVLVVHRLSLHVTSRPCHILNMHEKGTYERTCTSLELRSLVYACSVPSLTLMAPGHIYIGPCLPLKATMRLLDWELGRHLPSLLDVQIPVELVETQY